MNSDFYLPAIIFFATFFVVFSLIELLIIYVLNRLESRYWEFMVDFVIRLDVHYGRAIKFTVILFIFLLIAAIFTFTPVIEIWRLATPVLRYFAVMLFFVMILIYYTTTRKMIKLAIEKKIHKYLYIILSLVVYVFILVMADQSLGAYRNFITTRFITPTVRTVQEKMDKQMEARLLNQFREKIYAGECPPMNYRLETETEKGLKHFVYITTDIDLAVTEILATEKDAAPDLRGRACTDGENTFLLTDDGRWYWVIEELM